jgi:hypothetical protein
VKIDVPTNLSDDSGWMGLFLYAYFSVHEDQAAIPGKPDSAISPELNCYLESNVAGSEQVVPHVLDTTKEEFRRLYTQDGFLWLSYIPRRSFPDWLNQSSCLEASCFSDWPGLMVQNCGLRFFHVHDKEEFEKIIFRCSFASKVVNLTRQSPAKVGDYPGERGVAKNQYNDIRSLPVIKKLLST